LKAHHPATSTRTKKVAQVSDYTGAAALMVSLLKAEWLLENRGYDAD
jgi:hypothetical protein